MDHAEIKNLLPLKALARLEGEEARAVDEHLAAGCDECERELASLTEALAAMAMVEAGGDGPSDRIWSRLQARLDAARDEPGVSDRGPRRIEDRSTREASRGRGFTLLGSAAAAAVVAIVVSSIFLTGGSAPSPPKPRMRLRRSPRASSRFSATLTPPAINWQRFKPRLPRAPT